MSQLPYCHPDSDALDLLGGPSVPVSVSTGLALRGVKKRGSTTVGIRFVVQFVAVLAATIPSLSCKRQGAAPADSEESRRPVVLYASIDEPIARPILDVFRKATGVEVSVVSDSEAGKTTGLVNRLALEAKSGRPRADVFWSGEIFQTIGLAREGLLAPYEVLSACDVPAEFRDARHRWTAFALRARVLAYDSAETTSEDLPKRWEDLAEPRFAPHLAMANPLFGTTRGHVAAIFAAWGGDRGRVFLTHLRDRGCHFVDGNSAAVRAVLDGRAKFAVTDSDDVRLAQKVRPSLAATYPDLGTGGTLLIPCTVALIRGGPNQDQGRKLVEFLASAEVERMLAETDARFLPVRAALRKQLGLELPPASSIAFETVADSMNDATTAVREILVR